MPTLLLLRHAKSSWDNAFLSDHDRPLNKRGLRDAPRMGGLLRDRDLAPDRILCSTAKRAKMTAELVRESLGSEPPVDFRSQLYHASPQDCLEAIREVTQGVGRLLLVAHNPGMEELVEALTGESETMPTAALAVIQCDVDDWADLQLDETSRLLHLYRPKELP